MSRRSYLFVPGDRPDRFRKATDSDADAIILDLEDAVAADRKAEARERLGLRGRAAGKTPAAAGTAAR